MTFRPHSTSRLITVTGFGDFGLRKASFDGRDHAAHPVDLVNISLGGFVDIRR